MSAVESLTPVVTEEEDESTAPAVTTATTSSTISDTIRALIIEPDTTASIETTLTSCSKSEKEAVLSLTAEADLPEAQLSNLVDENVSNSIVVVTTATTTSSSTTATIISDTINFQNAATSTSEELLKEEKRFLAIKYKRILANGNEIVKNKFRERVNNLSILEYDE